MSEKPTPQMFYVQDPFTEEVHGPLSASDLKQRFSRGGLNAWGVSKSTTGPWTPASQVKGLRQPTAPSPESDTTAKSTVTSNTSLSGGDSVGKSTATATSDSSASFFGFFARITGGGCSLIAIAMAIALVLINVTEADEAMEARFFVAVLLITGFLTAAVGALGLSITKPKAVALEPLGFPLVVLGTDPITSRVAGLKSYQDLLEVFDDRVTITPIGIQGFLNKGLKGTKEIPFSSITAVQFKKAGAFCGYLQFTIPGGNESTGGLFNAMSDKNTFGFADAKNNALVREIKEYIDAAVRRSRTPQANAPATNLSDELQKLSKLKEQGVLSEEEFQAAKRRLIG